MLEHIAATQMPILLSSGMSSWAEVASAVSALGSELKVIFQCSSQYPCPPESVGLNIIPELAERYPNIIPGFSDHTSDNISSIAAWLYGARVFEKHFTLSKNMYGPDSRFSLEPHEMKNYVDGIDYIAKAVGSSIDKDDLSKYNDMKNIFEKSIVAADELSEGTVLILEHLNFKKPGWGIRADSYKHVIGKKLKTNKKYDDLINFDDLEDA
jgi:sialic acid synthase SpsE